MIKYLWQIGNINMERYTGCIDKGLAALSYWIEAVCMSVEKLWTPANMPSAILFT
jgi:hypothetical protein